MKQHRSGPSWLMLILFLGLLIWLFFLDQQAQLSRMGHILNESIIVLLVYGLLAVLLYLANTEK